MKQHEIKINLPGLLKMLGSNIYAEPDVAVRELIQNAHDTCIIRQDKYADFTQPRIDVSYDRAARTLTFSDNGMGMTEEELHNYLSTIGEGFTRIQKDTLSGLNAQKALLLIGQFGIGLLSAFSVAQRVEVYTRSCQPGATGFRWQCEGDIHYTVEETTVTTPGTRLVLHLNDSSLVLLDDVRLRQAIKKYADFLSVPIYLMANRVNSGTPPWLQIKEDGTPAVDFNDYIHDRYNLYPMAILPFAVTEPLPLDGLLFVPVIPYELTRDFGEVDIYIARMFIKGDDKALLPGWARFIKGVINTSSLTPTVSRDEVVRDEVYAAIQEMLGEIILDYLALWEEKSPETLDVVVGAYNNTIKARSVDDNDFFDRICDLVRMKTSEGDMSMKAYLGQSDGTIYYFSERGTGTQHKLLFAHKNLPVIDASWGMEEEFLEKYAQRKGVQLERLEAGSGLIFQEVETVDEKWRDLERQFKLQVKNEAKIVTFDPPTVPAVLVARPLEHDDKELTQFEGMGQGLGLSSSQLRGMFAKMAQGKAQRAAGNDMILHLNMSNPLMQQLRDMNRTPTFNLALTAIYSNALMFAQHYVTPESAEIIFATNNAAFSAMISNARALAEVEEQAAALEIERDGLRRKLPQVALTPHRSCFFAFDTAVAENKALADAVRAYFQEKGYGIQVITSDMEDWQARLPGVHFGLAEISGNDPDVYYWVGTLKGRRKPVILLRRQQNGDPTSTDFRVVLRQILNEHFNDSELRDFCFDLGIEYENLPGPAKSDKVRELVAYAQRLGRMGDLVSRGKQLRPHANWQPVAVHVPIGILSNYQIEYGSMKKDGKIAFVWLEDELDKVMPTLLQTLPELKQAKKWAKDS